MAFWLTRRFRAITVAGDNENEGRTMTTPKTMLSDESQQQIEQLAREQQREPGEVLEEAVRRYAAGCRLERFADKMGQRAREKGIREEDVPRLVEEVRHENAVRSR
jgi:predicted transcriptional regulator